MRRDAEQGRPADQPHIGKADDDRNLAKRPVASGAPGLGNDDRESIAKRQTHRDIGHHQQCYLCRGDGHHQQNGGDDQRHGKKHMRPDAVCQPVAGKSGDGHGDAEPQHGMAGLGIGKAKRAVKVQR